MIHSRKTWLSMALLVVACGEKPPEPFSASSPESSREAETTVAAAPDGRVLVAWMAQAPKGTWHIGYRFSKTKGVSWEALGTFMPPEGTTYCDPVAALGPQNELY